MGNLKRTACYLRVSTSRQAEEGDSIPAQRDALRKYINDHRLRMKGKGNENTT